MKTIAAKRSLLSLLPMFALVGCDIDSGFGDQVGNEHYAAKGGTDSGSATKYVYTTPEGHFDLEYFTEGPDAAHVNCTRKDPLKCYEKSGELASYDRAVPDYIEDMGLFFEQSYSYYLQRDYPVERLFGQKYNIMVKNLVPEGASMGPDGETAIVNHINMNSNMSGWEDWSRAGRRDHLRQTAAHELFHIVQLHAILPGPINLAKIKADDLGYRWLFEATAAFMQNEVFPHTGTYPLPWPDKDILLATALDETDPQSSCATDYCKMAIFRFLKSYDTSKDIVWSLFNKDTAMVAGTFDRGLTVFYRALSQVFAGSVQSWEHVGLPELWMDWSLAFHYFRSTDTLGEQAVTWPWPVGSAFWTTALTGENKTLPEDPNAPAPQGNAGLQREANPAILKPEIDSSFEGTSAGELLAPGGAITYAVDFVQARDKFVDYCDTPRVFTRLALADSVMWRIGKGNRDTSSAYTMLASGKGSATIDFELANFDSDDLLVTLYNDPSTTLNPLGGGAPAAFLAELYFNDDDPSLCGPVTASYSIPEPTPAPAAQGGYYYPDTGANELMDGNMDAGQDWINSVGWIDEDVEVLVDLGAVQTVSNFEIYAGNGWGNGDAAVYRPDSAEVLVSEDGITFS